MAKKKITSVNELSSAELYELAKRREEEERRQQLEANKERLKELRAQRRSMLARHKRELAEIDNEIARLSGKAPKKSRSPRGSVTETVLELISQAGTITTTEIRKALSEKGLSTDNLPQTLAYLKRQGRITSPSRATYQIAQ